MTRIHLYLYICVELTEIRGYEEFDYIKSDSVSEAQHKCLGRNGTLHIPKEEKIYSVNITYANDLIWNGYLHKTPRIENKGCYRIIDTTKELRLKDCEMSVAVCWRACQRNQKREVYIAVKPSECICTTKENFNSFKEVKAGDCDNVCNNNEHESCGSTKKLELYNIYKTGNTDESIHHPNSHLKSAIASHRRVKAVGSIFLKKYKIFWLNKRMYEALSTEVVSEECQLLSRRPHREISVRNCKMIGPVIFLCKKGAREKHRCQWADEKPTEFASTTQTEMPLSSQGSFAFPSLSSTESYIRSSESHSFKNTSHRGESRNRNRSNFTVLIVVTSVSVFILFITVMALVVYFNRKRAKSRSDTSITPDVEFDTIRNVCKMRHTSGLRCLTEPSERRNMGSLPHLKGTQSKGDSSSLKTVHPSLAVEENDSQKNESMKSVLQPSHCTGYSVDNEASHYETTSIYHTLRETSNQEYNENADYDHIREGMSYKNDNSGDTYSHVDKFNLEIESEQSDTYAHTDKDDTYAHTDKDDTYAHTDKDDTYAHTDKDDTYAHTDKDDTYTHNDKDDIYNDKDDTYAHTDKDDTYAHTSVLAVTSKEQIDDTYAHTSVLAVSSKEQIDDTYAHTSVLAVTSKGQINDTYAHTSVLAVTSKEPIDDTYSHTENIKRL